MYVECHCCFYLKFWVEHSKVKRHALCFCVRSDCFGVLERSIISSACFVFLLRIPNIFPCFCSIFCIPFLSFFAFVIAVCIKRTTKKLHITIKTQFLNFVNHVSIEVLNNKDSFKNQVYEPTQDAFGYF